MRQAMPQILGSSVSYRIDVGPQQGQNHKSINKDTTEYSVDMDSCELWPRQGWKRSPRRRYKQNFRQRYGNLGLLSGSAIGILKENCPPYRVCLSYTSKSPFFMSADVRLNGIPQDK